MSSITVHPIRHLKADFEVPGDKSISHRAAIFAGLSDGACRIDNYLPSEDCLCTLNAMAQLGAGHEVLASKPGYGPTSLTIEGRSMQLQAPTGSVDCGNSGTGMRLLAGLLAAQPFESVLTGDASLQSRPMGRIIKPLEAMGATIEARGDAPGCAPLHITGSTLNSICYEMPVASAQVKSAVLLAGLFADGKTSVIEPAETRDHTERMLAYFGISTERDGQKISVEGGQIPAAGNLRVPGDISSAAFWLVAAASMPGAHLLIRNVGMNPTRTAILDVLRRMGADIQATAHSDQCGEPYGDVEVRGNSLEGTEIRPEEVPNLIDEIPVLAVAGALAKGRMSIRNAKELRVKESDRIATVAHNLKAMGADLEEYEDGMEIKGGGSLSGAELESFGDHRIAMAFAIAGLFADGETSISNTACIDTSYPGFAEHLELIQNGCSDGA
ncbi:MAG: 3-phosphoshikimate 1-carboxyvinyltransferase [Akkermansiaceae bacterium]